MQTIYLFLEKGWPVVVWEEELLRYPPGVLTDKEATNRTLSRSKVQGGSQMPKKKPQEKGIPEVHPVIQALEGLDERAVELRGYPGKASKGQIRLHHGLDGRSYADISMNDIIHLEDESSSGRTRVWVRESAAVNEVWIRPAKNAAVRRRVCDSLLAEPLKPGDDPETIAAIYEAMERQRCMRICEQRYPKGSPTYLECISKC